MKKLWLVAVFLMPCLSSNAYSAQLVNYGFETGDTTGWTETYPGYASVDEALIKVAANWTGGSSEYNPAEGNYFAVLETGAGNWDSRYTVLSRSFSLEAGDKLEGQAAFCCGEEVYFPYEGDNGSYNDYAQIEISNGDKTVADMPWYADSYDIGYNLTVDEGGFFGVWYGEVVSFGPLQWEPWSWTAGAPGLYTLQYKVSHGGDAEGASYAFFDAHIQNTSVPEPSVMVLSGLVFLGIMGMRVFGKSLLNTPSRLA